MNVKQLKNLSVLVWGTYDVGKPRTRITLKALNDAGFTVSQIHRPIWEGVEDKSTLGRFRFLRFLCKALFAYPILIFRFLCHPRPDAVIVTYPGHLDILILWPFARIRRIPIVWDVFISVYDTVVDDRELVSSRSIAAILLYWLERLSCKAAHHLVLDTEAQADYFRQRYKVPSSGVSAVPVGSEVTVFQPQILKGIDHPEQAKTVLFYGQFIPLHGIDTIVKAAKLSENLPIVWNIIGTGQMHQAVQQQLDQLSLKNLRWTTWVPYEELIDHITRADVCLGVFGNSAKAGRVIPNKVYQILTSGRPLVTRDGPAIRELIPTQVEGIELVDPDHPEQLVAAVKKLLDEAPYSPDLHSALQRQFSAHFISARWSDIIHNMIAR